MLMNRKSDGLKASIYESPGLEFVETSNQTVICESNEPLTEEYLGDGGFIEV